MYLEARAASLHECRNRTERDRPGRSAISNIQSQDMYTLDRLSSIVLGRRTGHVWFSGHAIRRVLVEGEDLCILDDREFVGGKSGKLWVVAEVKKWNADWPGWHGDRE